MSAVLSRPEVARRFFPIRALLIACVVLVMAGFVCLVQFQYKAAVRGWDARLSAIADGEVLFVKNWLRDHQADAELLSSAMVVIAALSDDGERGPVASVHASHRASVTLDRYTRISGYTGIYIVDLGGTVAASSSHAPRLASSVIGVFSNVTECTIKTLRPPERTGPGAQVTFACPVFAPPAEVSSGPRRLGAVVLATSAEGPFDLPLLASTTQSGESMVIAKQEDGRGYFLSAPRSLQAYLSGLRTQQKVGISPSVFAVNSVVQRHEGFAEFRDYRGVPVLGVTRYVPEVDWGLITEVERSEAMGAFRKTVVLEALITAALLVVFVSTFIEVGHRQRWSELLRASEQQVRLLLDSTAEAIVGLDAEGRCSFCNQAALRIAGCDSAAELLGKDVHGLFHHSHADGTAFPKEDCAIHRDTKAGRVAHIEDVFWRRDGTSFVGECWSHPLLSEGRPIGAVVTYLDVTERKRAEEAVQKSEERLKAIFDNAGVGIMEADENLCIVDANNNACATMGHSREELIGKNVLELTAPEDRPYTLELNRRLHSGEIKNFEWDKRYLRRDGSSIWTHITVSALHDSAGRFIRGVATVADITRRREAEEALRRANEELSAIYASAPVALLVVDDALRVEKLNNLASRFSGSSLYPLDQQGPGNVVGCVNAAGPYGCGHGPLCSTCVLRTAALESLRHGVTKENVEIWISSQADAETKRRCLLVSTSPLHFHASQKALICIQEITELKLAEANVRTLNAELEQRVEHRTAQLQAANQELESFSYSVSHDLRAPIRQLDGFSKILLEEHAKELSPETQHYFQVIRQSATHMGDLVDGLLRLSRLGRQALNYEHVSPSVIAKHAVDELPEAGGRVEILIDDLPSCEADQLLLQQVFVNLVSNAVKYSRTREHPRVEIGWSKLSDLRDKNAAIPPGPDVCSPQTVVYYIRDNGVGFDMRYADKLFGTFQRLHRKEEFEGTGVGLAIVRRIIHKHGGQVWAESELDRGTIFYFTLNGDRASDGPIVASTQRKQAGAA